MANDVVDFAECGNHDCTMIRESDRVDGFCVANRREVGNDREDATGIDVCELFTEDHGGWRTGQKS